jgi:hypothetical protein
MTAKKSSFGMAGNGAQKFSPLLPVKSSQDRGSSEAGSTGGGGETLVHGHARRTPESPVRRLLRDADGVRASEAKHAVEHVNGDSDFGLLPAIVVRSQSIANHLLEPPYHGFHAGALVVAGSLLPTNASQSSDGPQMTVGNRCEWLTFATRG